MVIAVNNCYILTNSSEINARTLLKVLIEPDMVRWPLVCADKLIVVLDFGFFAHFNESLESLKGIRKQVDKKKNSRAINCT